MTVWWKWQEAEATEPIYLQPVEFQPYETADALCNIATLARDFEWDDLGIPSWITVRSVPQRTGLRTTVTCMTPGRLGS